MLKIYFGLRGPSFQTTIDPVARFLDAVEERDAPDAVSFAWWGDDRLYEYFKSGEWVNLSHQDKLDLKTILEMRGLISVK